MSRHFSSETRDTVTDQLRWFDHVSRMSQEILARQVMPTKARGKRPRGRPWIRWATASLTLLDPVLVSNQQNYLILPLIVRYFESSWGCHPCDHPQTKNGHENEWGWKLTFREETFFNCRDFYCCFDKADKNTMLLSDVIERYNIDADNSGYPNCKINWNYLKWFLRSVFFVSTFVHQFPST